MVMPPLWVYDVVGFGLSLLDQMWLQSWTQQALSQLGIKNWSQLLYPQLRPNFILSQLRALPSIATNFRLVLITLRSFYGWFQLRVVTNFPTGYGPDRWTSWVWPRF